MVSLSLSIQNALEFARKSYGELNKRKKNETKLSRRIIKLNLERV